MRTIALLALALAACSAAPQRGPGGAEAVRLERVVDGDTIVVSVAGRTERVRLIGIDTPERGECFFAEAARHLRSLLDGRDVRIKRDVSERDRYGRLVRYVFAGDEHVNETMVADGYAAAFTYPPDVANARRFVALQREARAEGRGLWGACR